MPIDLLALQHVVSDGAGSQFSGAVPMQHAALGAAFMVLTSAAFLVFGWRTPRFEPSRRSTTDAGSRLAVDAVRHGEERLRGIETTHPWLVWLLRVPAISGYVLVWLGLIVGVDASKVVAPQYLLAGVWAGLVPAAILLGPLVPFMNPLRAIHALLLAILPAHGPIAPTRAASLVPKRAGVRLAACAMLVFVWIALVFPHVPGLPVLRTAFVLHAAFLSAGAFRYGPGFFAAADPFEALARLVSHLSWWREEPRSPERVPGQPRVKLDSPLRHLASLRAAPGHVALVCVTLGAAAWGLFAASSGWTAAADTIGSAVLAETVGLVAVMASIMVIYRLGCLLLGQRPVPGDEPSVGVSRTFLPALVPLTAAFLVLRDPAEYVDDLHGMVTGLSDPAGVGWNLFGTAGLPPWSHVPAFVSAVGTAQVVALVVGHAIAIVAAHDRAAALKDKGLLLAKAPMLVALTVISCCGLAMLAAV